MKKLIFYFILISGFQNIFTSQKALFSAIDKANEYYKNEDYDMAKTFYDKIETLLNNPKICIINLLNKYGSTPLTFAAENNDIRAVTILLKAGADPNIPNHDGNIPLILALDSPSSDTPAWNSNIYEDITNLFIEYNANLDIQNNDGNTILMKTALHGYSYIVKLLLKNKAKLNIKNKKGETALNLAFYFDNAIKEKQYYDHKRETIFMLLEEYYKNYLREQNHVIEAIYTTANLPADINMLIREYLPYYNFFDYLAEQLDKPLPENYIQTIKKFLDTKIKRKSDSTASQVAKKIRLDNNNDENMSDDNNNKMV